MFAESRFVICDLSFVSSSFVRSLFVCSLLVVRNDCLIVLCLQNGALLFMMSFSILNNDNDIRLVSHPSVVGVAW